MSGIRYVYVILQNGRLGQRNDDDGGGSGSILRNPRLARQTYAQGSGAGLNRARPYFRDAGRERPRAAYFTGCLLFSVGCDMLSGVMNLFFMDVCMQRRPNLPGLFILLLVLLCWPLASAHAQGRWYGILGKSSDDPNFVDVASGCQQAAKEQGDVCALLEVPGPATPRPQVSALQQTLATRKFDAFAVSVVLSAPLANTVRSAVNVPVITFDSPFAVDDRDASLAYVGSDNVSFGRDLARLAKQIKPQGGRIVLMSASHDPNLEQRLVGIRRELSGDDNFPGERRLQGENGWTEIVRSPWQTGDQIDRTMDQLVFSLKEFDVDVILSVGHWPVIQPEKYRQAVRPYSGMLRARDCAVIAGVGKISTGIRALLDDGLVAGVVSIDFPEIGRKVYGVLDGILEGREVPAATYVPNRMVTGHDGAR